MAWDGIDHTADYDVAGNETSYFPTRTYSPRNLFATVTDNSGEGTPHTISYGYDARGVRVTRSESPTSSGTSNRYFTYTPELQLISITDDDSSNLWASGHASIFSNPIAPSREFGYFNGMPVSEFGPPRTPDSTVTLTLPRHAPAALATTLYYTFTDHLGTPLLQTDSSGNVAWRAEYEPYGNAWTMRKGSRTDQPLRLPGQDLAMTWEGTEENYNVFRWYRAGWGRYTQADELGLDSGANLYRYSSNDPIGEIDPEGESTVNVQKTNERTYPTQGAYQSANPCHQHGLNYSCTERVREHLSCTCRCLFSGLYAMGVTIDVDVVYHLAGGPPAAKQPSRFFWNGYRRHEDLHFQDLITQLRKYGASLEAGIYQSMDDCNQACGKAIGGFHDWLNNWAIDSNRRLH